MGEKHVGLRVHMYHEPMGTRVTRVTSRVYECAKWIRLGGSPSRGRSGEVPLWVEMVADRASAVSPLQPEKRSSRLTVGRFSAVTKV